MSEEISYKPLIEDMTWSFSRVESFCDCPYRWYLKYIRRFEDEDKFFATYGSFMHSLIERYYKGELTKDGMLLAFLRDFSKEVRGIRPPGATLVNYIDDGKRFLQNFEPFEMNMVAVEKEVKFQIDGIPFVGYIDYLGERDGELYIIDHKSRNLKPRTNRKKPTISDVELDERLKQLYLYSEAIYNEFGKYPSYLCFNCFREGIFIKEPFLEDAFQNAKAWAVSTIHEIEEENVFTAEPEFFRCVYLCGVRDYCDRQGDFK